MFDAATGKQFLKRLDAVFTEKLDELSKLDSLLGDGDHGTSMHKGFSAVYTEIANKDYATPAEYFTDAYKVIMKQIGGTCGPLFGSIFMKGALLCRGKQQLDTADFAAIFTEANKQIKALGKANAGDKTMIDALEPAAQALSESSASAEELNTAVGKARQAADAGAAATENMLATKGRGRYQGERSLGLRDPGAQSVALVFRALDETLNG